MSGQLVNLSTMGNELGLSYHTIKSWLSVLEASFIIFFLYPHFLNFKKRLVKSPKLYFYDTGLACHLLGIRSEEQIQDHYLRGSLFETFVISEFKKYIFNKGEQDLLSFWRDNSGNEVDCIIESGNNLIPVEIKSGKTIHADFFKGLNYWNKISGNKGRNSYLVYGGVENQKRSYGNVVGWKDIQSVMQTKFLK